jgi:hypothetical protein
MAAYISEEFKITNIKKLIMQRFILLKIVIVGLNQKISLLAYDEESGKERKTNMYFFSTGKR